MIAWFLGTKVGRALAFAAAFAGLLAVACWRIFAAGKRSERIAQTEQSLRNHKAREEVHNHVASRPDDQRRSDLGRWVRD
jgi:Flp pilus assembly protein TadB